MHRAKLDAFLDRFLAGTEPVFARALRTLWLAWNGFAAWPEPARWPERGVWQAACEHWRQGLFAQPDLVTQLKAFAAARLQNAVE